MSSASHSRRAFLGNALHTPTRGRIELLPGVLIEVDNGGVIQAIHRRDTPQAAAGAAHHRAAGSLVTLEKNEYLLPGLVDLHVHAPQWPQLGLALDRPLEEWLQACTFPLEARYGDTDYARFRTPARRNLITIEHGSLGSYNLHIQGVSHGYKVNRIR